MKPLRSHSAGITLLEIMATVTIVMIVAAIAMPSYRTVIRTARLTTQIYDFNAALNLARSEAVKRGVPVTVCPSTNQTACGASGTQWESGWIVFVDNNNNQTVDTGEPILRAATALVAGYTLRGSTGLTSYVTMNPKGQLSVAANGQFVLCENSQINPSRAILVNNVGRISIAADDNGVPVDAGGADMTTCTP